MPAPIYNPLPERAVPKVPGLNASAMGMQQSIGHTPWRCTAPVREDGTVGGKPAVKERTDPRPTSGRNLDTPRFQRAPRTANGHRATSSNRAARAARARARKRGVTT